MNLKSCEILLENDSFEIYKHMKNYSFRVKNADVSKSKRPCQICSYFKASQTNARFHCVKFHYCKTEVAYLERGEGGAKDYSYRLPMSNLHRAYPK